LFELFLNPKVLKTLGFKKASAESQAAAIVLFIIWLNLAAGATPKIN
jgi:hypothetical protein